MNGRALVKAIINRESVDRSAFWTGMPHKDTWPILYRYFGTESKEEIFLELGDDIRWIDLPPHSALTGYDDFEKGPLPNPTGHFDSCETAKDVHSWPWPNPGDVNFTDTLHSLEEAGDFYRLSGNLSMFFHSDCFQGFGGMQNYFIKMYTHPEVVHAVTRRVNDYYLQLNRRFFRAAGDLFDGLFLSHDFGTQLSLLLSPEMLEEFVFPYLREQIDLGHEYGYQVILHCCGAISRLLPRFIEMGVDSLHPIQALAAGMQADALSNYSEELSFIGGIDTQDLLVNGSPEEITTEVMRVDDILGPLIIGPSHEALLPNVPPENVEALARAAKNRGT